MNRDFRQDVVLALLNDIKGWAPTFDSAESAAEYLSVDVPKNTADLIDLQATALAAVLDIVSQKIVDQIGEYKR